MVNRKSVFILLGPSGVGKTSVVKSIAEHNGYVTFLSTGDKLWQSSVLEPWTERNKDLIKQRCHEMIMNTFEEFAKSRRHRILLLDCVKDLADAEYVTLQAKRHDLVVTQALPIALPVDSIDSVADILEECWKRRGAPRLGLQKSAGVYLKNWRANFTAVQNYYKRMDILAIPQPANNIIGIVSGEEQTRVVTCPDYVSFLLLDSSQCEKVYDDLLYILRVSSFHFSLPVSFVHSARDVTWVSDPRRYHVTRKTANAVRFLLFKINDNYFLINANREIFPCDIDNKAMPNDTVLDGELLPSLSFADIDPSVETSFKSSVFLVCDVLALSKQIKWTLPFSMRLRALDEMNIDDDINAVIKKAYLAMNNVYPGYEINPRKLPVRIVTKKHQPSTPSEIESCLSSTIYNLPYMVPGLVFTPETPYAFGADSLAFQWCPQSEIHCSVRMRDLVHDRRPCTDQSYEDVSMNNFPAEPVTECQWDCECNAWRPLFIKGDKAIPDSEDMIDHVQRICEHPYDEWQLNSDVQRQKGSLASFESCSPNVLHPSLTYDFDELYCLVKNEVRCDRVRETTDSSTNLEMFNCVGPSSKEKPITQLCHGFVLHPQSKRVVTMPFLHFYQSDSTIVHSLAEDIIEATIKFDGIFGVAFLWNYEVKVVTKDNMDSDESRQATKWIKENCNVTKFRVGYTYVFEIIFKENMKIVEYPFEGLVLLSITTNEGLELSYNQMLEHCKIVGFLMVTPRIYGHLSEVLWYCAGKSHILGENAPPNVSSLGLKVSNFVKPRKSSEKWNFKEVSNMPNFSGALPASTKSHEGWVVRFRNGTRKKIVHKWWNEAHSAATLVHPQVIWLLVKYDNIHQVFQNLPSHFQQEVDQMMYALGRQFFEVLKSISELEQNSSPFSSTNAALISHQHAPRQSSDLEVQQRLSNLAVKLTSFIPDICSLFSRNQALPEGIWFNISPLYSGGEQCNDLRLPILDFNKPNALTTVGGYEPSSNIKEAWAKYWRTLPINNEELSVLHSVFNFIHGPCLLLSCFPDEILLTILSFLDGKNLIMMSRVCQKFRKVILVEKVFQKKIFDAKSEHDRKAEEARYFSSEDYCSQDSYS